MRRWIAGTIAGAALLAAGCTPPTPTPPDRIGPGESFRGLVNGQGDGAVVTTVCGGPGVVGRVGPVLDGQTVTVRRSTSGPGRTDRSGTLFARASSSGFVVQVTAYGTATSLDGLQVPCEGKGVIVFDPCFGIIGCVQGGTADEVEVTFVNIAD